MQSFDRTLDHRLIVGILNAGAVKFKVDEMSVCIALGDIVHNPVVEVRTVVSTVCNCVNRILRSILCL